MTFLNLFSPARAYDRFRAFLGRRRKHELLFLAMAMGITSLLIAGFVKDSSFARPYQREIIYVEDWRLDRTSEEIRERQKMLDAQRAEREAALLAAQEKRQAEFKRLDDKLRSWGF